MNETIQWIDVNKQMPDDETTVLVYGPMLEVWLGHHEYDYWLSIDGVKMNQITHWAHVPQGPQAKE